MVTERGGAPYCCVAVKLALVCPNQGRFAHVRFTDLHSQIMMTKGDHIYSQVMMSKSDSIYAQVTVSNCEHTNSQIMMSYCDHSYSQKVCDVKLHSQVCGEGQVTYPFHREVFGFLYTSLFSAATRRQQHIVHSICGSVADLAGRHSFVQWSPIMLEVIRNTAGNCHFTTTNLSARYYVMTSSLSLT